MELVIVSPGKSKHSYIDENIGRYIKNCYKPLELNVDFFNAKRDRFNEISRTLKGDELILICDERGEELTSVEFADYIRKKLDNSIKKIYFFIGDAEGFGSFKIEGKHKKIALSKLTMTHDFARLFLAEQVFRTSSIIKGTAYHK